MARLLGTITGHSIEYSDPLRLGRAIVIEMGQNGSLSGLEELVQADQKTQHPASLIFKLIDALLIYNVAVLIRLAMLPLAISTGLILLLSALVFCMVMFYQFVENAAVGQGKPVTIVAICILVIALFIWGGAFGRWLKRYFRSLLSLFEWGLALLSGLVLWGGMAIVLAIIGFQVEAIEAGWGPWAAAAVFVVFLWSALPRGEGSLSYWLFFPNPINIKKFRPIQFGIVFMLLQHCLYLLFVGIVVLLLAFLPAALNAFPPGVLEIPENLLPFFDESAGIIFSVCMIILWVWRKTALNNLSEEPFPLGKQFAQISVYLYRLTLFKISIEHSIWQCCRHNMTVIEHQPYRAVCDQCLRRFSQHTYRSSMWFNVTAWRCDCCKTDQHCRPNVRTIEICLDRQLKSNHRRLWKEQRKTLMANGILPPGPGNAESPWVIDFDIVTIGRVDAHDIEQFLLNCENRSNGTINRKIIKQKTCCLSPEYQSNFPDPADLARLVGYFGARHVIKVKNSEAA